MIFLLVLIVDWGGGGCQKNYNDWIFQIYKGNKLCYDMLFNSVNSDQEEKEVDLLNGNRIINIKNLITNIDSFSVQRISTGEGYIDKIRIVKRARKLRCLC